MIFTPPTFPILKSPLHTRGAGRPETLLEQLVWTIGGGGGATGAIMGGAPFVVVGAPGDYVFGGEGQLHTAQ